MRTRWILFGACLGLVIGCGDSGTSSATGGETTDATTGETTGGETTGGETTGGETTGGETTGGETTGGETTGGETTGGETTAAAGWKEACPTDEPEYRMVQLNDVSLNVACMGSGPVVVLLHGFPEYHLGWKGVMEELATDHRVIVPDQRGYNLSDKPEGLAAYEIQHLVADIVQLIDQVSDEPVVVVGHDWGGIVAWSLGALAADKLSHLVIANSPHPNVFARELDENPEQKAASGYISFFMGEVDGLLAANDFELLANTVFTDAFTDEEIAAYKVAWGQPGALTAMLNWYRANFADGKPKTPTDINVDTVPTLVLWGLADTALLAGNLVGLDQYVADLTIRAFPLATHWINHEYAAEVGQAIRDFRGGSDVTQGEPWTPPEDPEPEPEPEPEPDPGEWSMPVLPAGLVGEAVEENKLLPSLASVVNQDKQMVAEADFVGHWTVFWFYPKANTSG